MRKARLLTAIILATAAVSPALVRAASVTFTVLSKAEAQNSATVENATDIENWVGRTNKVSGTVQFDRTAKTGSATIIIDGASIDTGVEERNGHMRGKDWFDFDKNPQIRFVTTSVKNTGGDNYALSGNLTMKGITRSVKATAVVKMTPANEVTKMIGAAGDVLGVSTKFKVKLSDYGVKHPAIQAGRVSNELDVSVRFIASNQ